MDDSFRQGEQSTKIRWRTARGYGLTRAQALEGKDVRDMLLNVGSGGGAKPHDKNQDAN